MSAITLKSPASRLFTQPFIQGAEQRKHKGSASLALCTGNSPATGEFPAQRASNAENVSIWWRHHDMLNSCKLCIDESSVTQHFPRISHSVGTSLFCFIDIIQDSFLSILVVIRLYQWQGGNVDEIRKPIILFIHFPLDNIMPVDALAPKAASASAGMVLVM